MRYPMVVLVHGARAFGAVESYVVDLVRGLTARGERAVLVHADDPSLAPFAALAGERVRVEQVAAEALFGGGVRGLLELRRVFRRLRPDVVHVVDVWPVAMVAARAAGVRRLLLTHHTPELARRDNAAGRIWWGLGWAARPEVIYTSAFDRDQDARRTLRRHVVPLGIDLERFAAADPALPPNGPVIGTVGRLAEQKAQHVLLDAVPLVLERWPNARFVLVGDGPCREELERQARSLGVGDSVVFTGFRDDVPRWLASFDVFVLSSLFEGLCYAVIEAQAARVPVVATPVGGVRETVVDGETGIIVPVADANAVAGAIVRLLEQPDETACLVAEAAARAQRYSCTRMVEETLAVYRGGSDG
jgi:glycosyltransferase involved in cell wall biosynthesis